MQATGLMLSDTDKISLLRAALTDAVEAVKRVEDRFEDAACDKLNGKRVVWCDVAGLMAQDVTGRCRYWSALLETIGRNDATDR